MTLETTGHAFLILSFSCLAVRRRMAVIVAALAVVCLVGLVPTGCAKEETAVSSSSTGAAATSHGTTTSGALVGADTDSMLARAFAERATDLQVQGRGTVTRLLADDDEGGRHQRFIVRLASGQTLLIVHNIDIAPRVASLQVGDTVAFKGVYEWNEQGGVIHWTHHDPQGDHEPGWIEARDHVYQ